MQDQFQFDAGNTPANSERKTMDRDDAISYSVLFSTLVMNAYKTTPFDNDETKKQKAEAMKDEIVKTFLSFLETAGYTVVKREI